MGEGPQVAETVCMIGRHTVDTTNDINSGNCGYGNLTQLFGPGVPYGTALNDYNTSGLLGAVGYLGGNGNVVGSKCGVCYQITGINASLIVMVTNHCPDCDVLQPHFDMNPIPAAIIDGNSSAAGFTAITFREVSCGFTGNILYQWATVSSLYNLVINFAHHNSQLASYINVTEHNLPSYLVTRGTQSDGNYAWSPQGSGGAAFPIAISIYSLKGDVVTFITTTSNFAQLGVPIDTGGQFTNPPSGFNGGQPACSQCPPPLLNNGQPDIYVSGSFPQQIGPWLPKTSQAWSLYSAAFTAVTSPPPYLVTSTNIGEIALGKWGEVNIGCNVLSPATQVTSVIFAVRTSSGTGQLSVFTNGSLQTTLSPAPSTSWTLYQYNISGNPKVGSIFNGLQIQNGPTATTYYFDSFQFVFAADTSVCNPWFYDIGSSGPTSSQSQSTSHPHTKSHSHHSKSKSRSHPHSKSQSHHTESHSHVHTISHTHPHTISHTHPHTQSHTHHLTQSHTHHHTQSHNGGTGGATQSHSKHKTIPTHSLSLKSKDHHHTGNSKNSNSQNSKKTNNGAIAGGVIGGLLGVAAVLAIGFYLHKRRSAPTNSTEGPKTFQMKFM